MKCRNRKKRVYQTPCVLLKTIPLKDVIRTSGIGDGGDDGGKWTGIHKP